MKIKKYMKIPKIEIPLSPELESQISPTSEDIDQMEALVKQGRIKEFEDFINKKAVGAELSESEGYRPGLVARDFMDESLGGLILKRYPELKDMNNIQKTKFLREKVYPNLTDINKHFGFSNKVNYENSEHSGSFHPSSGLKIGKEAKKGTSESNKQVGTILHELGHNVDDIKRDMDDTDYNDPVVLKFIENNPKLKDMFKTKKKYTTYAENSREGYRDEKGDWKTGPYSRIERFPNFEDYNWEKGDFESDMVETPLSKYEEVGGEHHIDRPFSLENFKNLSKGDLKDIVKTNDRFRELIKKLS